MAKKHIQTIEFGDYWESHEGLKRNLFDTLDLLLASLEGDASKDCNKVLLKKHLDKAKEHLQIAFCLSLASNVVFVEKKENIDG